MDSDAHHSSGLTYPAVGIGIMLRRRNEVLLGLRRGSHGAGTWGWPGGGLAFGESLMDAVRREAAEETGIVVEDATLICVSNVVAYGVHYLDIEFQVTEFTGAPEVREPAFIEDWGWYPLDALPSPMFLPCTYALASLGTGFIMNDISPLGAPHLSPPELQ